MTEKSPPERPDVVARTVLPFEVTIVSCSGLKVAMAWPLALVPE